MAPYNHVPPQIDLPAMEHEILALWTADDTFEKSLAQTEGGEPWTFYEGPPTANGMPGTHHIEARVFKDVFPRFRTMRGFHVPRKAGWDCHGLPVELAVETELGFNGKPDIEAFGVEAFNARCRASVTRHVDDFEKLTTRMGYWVNLDEAYWTMSPEYVESVWWALAQIHRKGLLVEDYRVAPYCPRCGTTLSDHELAQGYEDVTDPSVYVRFPLTSGPLAGAADLLVWTTTPWTLVSNTAVAVHPDVTYVAATDGSETLVVAQPLLAKVLGDGWTVTRTFTGRDLERWQYPRPFDLVAFPEAEGASLCRPGGLRDDRGRDRPRPPGAGVRRGRHARLPPVRAADGQPDPPGRHVRHASPARWRTVRQDGRSLTHRGPAATRPAVPRTRVRAQLPALLALLHPAHLLGQALVVCRHVTRAGPSCSAANEAVDLAPRPHQARPLRRLAGEQRRLGVVA